MGREKTIRALIAAGSILGLLITFIFQKINFLELVSGNNYAPEMHFTVNRVARIFFNDLFMVGLVHAIFYEMKVVRLALFIQAIDLFILLPAYLMVKLSLEGPTEISSPILSQIHRLVVNPTLIILLIPAIYYQRHFEKQK